MIENECTVTRERYVMWTMPKFYFLPIFYIYLCIFIFSIFAVSHLVKIGADKKWILLFGFLALAVFYLAIFHKWVTAISQYKVLLKKAFNGTPWKQKVIVDNDSIKLYINDELSNTVAWDKIKSVAIAKSFVALKHGSESEKIIIFDDSYIKGSKNELLSYIKSIYKELPIIKERLRYDK